MSQITVGPNSPGTGTNVNVTGNAWSNPGNITASDNNRATVEGNGTTELISDYTFIDPLPFEGNNYYRLSQTDYDGAFEVFKPIMVNYEKEGSIFKIYPNPVTDGYVNLTVNPDLLNGENNNTYILVRSITGELIHRQLVPTNTLTKKITLDQRISSGTYILELHSPYGESSKKLVVR